MGVGVGERRGHIAACCGLWNMLSVMEHDYVVGCIERVWIKPG